MSCNMTCVPSNVRARGGREREREHFKATGIPKRPTVPVVIRNSFSEFPWCDPPVKVIVHVHCSSSGVYPRSTSGRLPDKKIKTNSTSSVRFLYLYRVGVRKYSINSQYLFTHCWLSIQQVNKTCLRNVQIYMRAVLKYSQTCLYQQQPYSWLQYKHGLSDSVD